MEELPNKKYFRPDEVARFLDVHIRTVRRWAAVGKIKYERKHGQGIWIPKREVEKLFKNNNRLTD